MGTDLLANEAFYAADQNYRYHNHAMFQDIALLISTYVISEFDERNDLKKIATMRLKDQFEHLVYIDNEYAVSIENSPGYHDGIMSILDFLINILKYTNNEETEYFENLFVQMKKFSDLIKYPNSKLPAIGDTFADAQYKNCNDSESGIAEHFVGLDNVGYIIAEGKNDEHAFQFTQVATSLSQTHKHADNLSFTLFYDCIEWFTDPSFYSHQYEDEIPSYLRSAFAHNGITMDSVEYKNEINISEIKSTFNAQNKTFTTEGEHRAYDDCVITRKVIGKINELYFNFSDEIICQNKDDDDVAIYFQVGEHIKPIQNKEKVYLSSDLSDKTIGLDLSQCKQIEIFYGNENPVLGWRGFGFQEKERIYTIKCDIEQNILYNWHIYDATDEYNVILNK